MKGSMGRFAISGLIGLALIVSGCAGNGSPTPNSPGSSNAGGNGNNEAKVSQSFTINGDVTVTISSYAGTIQVKTGNSDQIQVDVIKHGGGASDAEAKADLDNIQLSLNQTAGNVKMVATHRGAAPTNSAASFAVTIPAGSALVASLDNGSMTVNGITGRLTLKGINGDMTVTNAGKGGISATTTNGNVTLSGSNLAVLKAATSNGDVSFSGSLAPSKVNRIDVGNGNANLTLPGDAQYTLDALTSNGTLTSDFTFQGDTAPTSIKGTVGTAPTFNVTVRVKNGTITVKKG